MTAVAQRQSDAKVGSVERRYERRTDQEWWYASWMDHRNVIVERKLGTTREIRSRAAARRVAQEAVQEHMERYGSLIAAKLAATPDEISETAEQAMFPREVVAHEIDRICQRIVRENGSEEARTGRPGIQIFAQRANVSLRETSRIIDQWTRAAVGIDFVDRICCEYGLIFEDFISSALDWASKRGIWERRAGDVDSWPFGYVERKSVPDPEDDEII